MCLQWTFYFRLSETAHRFRIAATCACSETWLRQFRRMRIAAPRCRTRHWDGSTAGDRTPAVRRSADLASDERTELVGERQRQSLPGSDHQSVFRVERIDVRQIGALHQPVLVAERLWREAPVGLVIERTGAAFAAAEVEHTHAAGGGALHLRPIHQIVRVQPTRRRYGAAVV